MPSTGLAAALFADGCLQPAMEAAALGAPGMGPQTPPRLEASPEAAGAIY